MLNTPTAYRGMITAPHHLAAQAGLQVLREGGNAIEAMISAAATIAVAEATSDDEGDLKVVVTSDSDPDGMLPGPGTYQAWRFEIRTPEEDMGPCDGDLEFVADLLETYLDDALPRVASLSEALATGNQDSAAALAHALKSGSANIGANIAAGHFEAIEDAGRAGSMDKITSSLASWESDFTATVDAIKNWLASNNSEE